MSEQRVTRKTAVQLQIEAVYGDGGTGWGPTDLLLVKEATFQIDRDLVPRNLIRPWLGASQDLIGTRRTIATVKVEMAGSGTAATPPQWGKILRAGAFAETIYSTGTNDRVEYTPISDAPESASMRFFIDGVMYVSKGGRTAPKLMLNAYGIPELEFTFWGYDTTATENTPATPAFTAWMEPQVITSANSGDLQLGPSYGAVGLTGGTAYPSKGIEIDIGNALTHKKLLGGESIRITDRQVTAKTTFALTTAQEVAQRTDVNANTLTSIGFRHGSAEGGKLIVHSGYAQRQNPQPVDEDGDALVSMDWKMTAPTAGSDLTICCK